MECAGCFFSGAILAGLFHAHIAGFHEALVPRQGFVQQMRCVQAARFFCAVEIVVQLVAVIGVRAVVDDEACALAGRFAAQVGHTLLGNDEHYIVFGVVVVRYHRHNAGNRAVFRHGGRYEEREEGVAREVARTADAVHHFGAHDVR